MSKIIKEPFAPRRCRPMIDYRRESSRVSRLSSGLQLRKLANASQRGHLWDSSFGLVVSDHSAFAMDRPVNCFPSIRGFSR
jgi:hypothetical protein